MSEESGNSALQSRSSRNIFGALFFTSSTAKGNVGAGCSGDDSGGFGDDSGCSGDGLAAVDRESPSDICATGSCKRLPSPRTTKANPAATEKVSPIAVHRAIFLLRNLFLGIMSYSTAWFCAKVSEE